MATGRLIGIEFEHPRVLEPDSLRPMRYRVTSIRRGMVYFAPVAGGRSECTDAAKFRQWIERRPT